MEDPLKHRYVHLGRFPASGKALLRGHVQPCFELLNQKATTNEYDCGMVCALAVLVRYPDESGEWVSLDAYTPILPKIIPAVKDIFSRKLSGRTVKVLAMEMLSTYYTYSF